MGVDPVELSRRIAGLSLAGPVAPFVVFADWLIGLGQPWGELIATSCSIEVAQAAGDEAALAALQEKKDALLKAHGRDLCFLYGSFGSSIYWRRGFLCYVSLDDCAGVDFFERDLTKLLSLPAAALLDELRLANCYMHDPHARVLLDAKDRLVRIKTLDLERNWFSPKIVARLSSALPDAMLGYQQRIRPGDQGGHREFIRRQGGPRSIEDIED